jgi:hypothetical protein
MFHFIFKNFKKINLQTSTDEVLASACYGGAAINLNIILIFSNYLWGCISQFPSQKYEFRIFST